MEQCQQTLPLAGRKPAALRIATAYSHLREGLVSHSAALPAQTVLCVSARQISNKHLPQSTGRENLVHDMFLPLAFPPHTAVIWQQSASQSLALDTISSIPLSQFPQHTSICPQVTTLNFSSPHRLCLCSSSSSSFLSSAFQR